MRGKRATTMRIRTCKSDRAQRERGWRGDRGVERRIEGEDVEHFAKVFTWLVGNFLLCCFIGIYV